MPTAALAHTGGSASGFVHGLAHPVGGLDHVLAMLAVGLLACQLGGRALWFLPASFMTAMAFGGWLGLAGVGMPHVEIGIAMSVIVLGAIVALGIKAPLVIAIGIAGLFAVFHGHAHGTEMPHDTLGAAYAAGFLVATAFLHLSGIALGFLIAQPGRLPLRLGGGVISLAGIAILAGMI
jgi:urease accessory protein